jgi:hypothetical protein
MADQRDPLFASVSNAVPTKAAPEVEPKERKKRVTKAEKEATPPAPKLAERATSNSDRWQLPPQPPQTVKARLPKFKVLLESRTFPPESKYHDAYARTASQARTHAEAAHPKWDAKTAVMIEAGVGN